MWPKAFFSCTDVKSHKSQMESPNKRKHDTMTRNGLVCWGCFRSSGPGLTWSGDLACLLHTSSFAYQLSSHCGPGGWDSQISFSDSQAWWTFDGMAWGTAARFSKWHHVTFPDFRLLQLLVDRWKLAHVPGWPLSHDRRQDLTDKERQDP